MHLYETQESDLVTYYGDRAEHGSCPNAKICYVDHHTGEIINSIPCRRTSCVYCNRFKERAFNRKMKEVEPSGFITVTGLPSNFTDIKNGMKELRQYLRRDGLRLGLAWSAEPNPRGTGVHVHAWVNGDVPTTTQLRHRAQQVGMASNVKVEKFSGWYGSGAAYITKMTSHNQTSLAAYQEINGREFVHSRSYWRAR